MRFIRHWKKFLLSTSLVAAFFLIWDAYFTHYGVWGFNEQYYLGFKILKMPIEEWLFFFCIPFASIFIHYVLEYFLPNVLLPRKPTKIITVLLLILSVLLAATNTDKLYTFVNFSVLAATLTIAYFHGQDQLRRFYLSFIFILIPFFLVNGVLTGSFIEEPVVWYNNAENLGIRMFTIPAEDTGYAFSMLLLNVMIFEYLKTKK